MKNENIENIDDIDHMVGSTENNADNNNDACFIMPDVSETKEREKDGTWFEIPGIGKPKFIELKIKFFSPTVMIRYTNKFQTQRVNRKTGSMEIWEDPEKKIEISREMVIDSVTDWKGIADKNRNAIPFTRENFRNFMELMSFNMVDFKDNEGDKMTLSAFILYCAQNSDMHFGEKKN